MRVVNVLIGAPRGVGRGNLVVVVHPFKEAIGPGPTVFRGKDHA